MQPPISELRTIRAVRAERYRSRPTVRPLEGPAPGLGVATAVRAVRRIGTLLLSIGDRLEQQHAEF